MFLIVYSVFTDGSVTYHSRFETVDLDDARCSIVMWRWASSIGRGRPVAEMEWSVRLLLGLSLYDGM